MQSVEVPDGERLTVVWTKNGSNNWTAGNLNCGNNAIPAPSNNPCRDAVVAITIAAGLCAAAPASPGCWAATANAAYQTYKCYESTHLSFNLEKAQTPNIYRSNPKFKRKTAKESICFKKPEVINS